MQSPDTNTRTAGAVNHPDAATWMAFLYAELPDAKKRELGLHLAQCPACAAQVKAWREGMNALDAWTLPARRPVRRTVVPVLKWAAAAALLLGLGVFLGRQTSRNTADIATLRNSVAQLTALVQQQNESTLKSSVAAANSETVRLLTDYSRLQEAQRAEDRQAIALTLRNIRTELETVALNTQTGFEETHQVLASFTEPSAKSNN